MEDNDRAKRVKGFVGLSALAIAVAPQEFTNPYRNVYEDLFDDTIYKPSAKSSNNKTYKRS